MVFPVSPAILDRINDYRKILESYSARLLPLIEWEPTGKGNVRVLNDTGDYYRFFDATPHAEFLYECDERTIERDLPAETSFLKAMTASDGGLRTSSTCPKARSISCFAFSARTTAHFRSAHGRRNFAEITEDEVARIEAIYAEAFSG